MSLNEFSSLFLLKISLNTREQSNNVLIKIILVSKILEILIWSKGTGSWWFEVQIVSNSCYIINNKEMDEKIPDFELFIRFFPFLSDHVILHLRVFASSAQGRYFCAQVTLWDFMRIKKERITLKYTYIS